jgi:hypothetical protein
MKTKGFVSHAKRNLNATDLKIDIVKSTSVNYSVFAEQLAYMW